MGSVKTFDQTGIASCLIVIRIIWVFFIWIDSTRPVTVGKFPHAGIVQYNSLEYSCNALFSGVLGIVSRHLGQSSVPYSFLAIASRPLDSFEACLRLKTSTPERTITCAQLVTAGAANVYGLSTSGVTLADTKKEAVAPIMVGAIDLYALLCSSIEKTMLDRSKYFAVAHHHRAKLSLVYCCPIDWYTLKVSEYLLYIA